MPKLVREEGELGSSESYPYPDYSYPEIVKIFAIDKLLKELASDNRKKNCKYLNKYKPILQEVKMARE